MVNSTPTKSLRFPWLSPCLPCLRGSQAHRSQVDDDVANRLGAAHENVAVGRLVEWLRSVDDLPETRPLSQV